MDFRAVFVILTHIDRGAAYFFQSMSANLMVMEKLVLRLFSIFVISTQPTFDQRVAFLSYTPFSHILPENTGSLKKRIPTCHIKSEPHIFSRKNYNWIRHDKRCLV